MRGFLGVAVTLLLIASPAMAGAAGPGDSPAPPAANASAAAPAAAKGSSDADAAAKTDLSSLEVEIEELRDLMQSQAKQLQIQNDQLAEQQKKMAALEDQLTTAKAARENLAAAPAVAGTTAVAGTSSPLILGAPAPSALGASVPTVPASTLSASVAEPVGSAAQPVAAPSPDPQAVPDSPLQLRIGSAYITPVGFMDFTAVEREHAAGGSIGTSFGSIPYSITAVGNHLSEFRESMQNSRFGFRVDALTHGAHVIGYMEADFLGGILPQNLAVSSNSNTVRSRVYWVDIRKDSWEILGGQTWSLITPGRVGISPIPGNLFYTDNIDTNYQAGLVWGRIPELRFVYHAGKTAAFAVALDNPEQYIGGSSGGAAITLPTALAGQSGFLTAAAASGTAANANGEFNNGNTTLNVPNYIPDIIVKAAFDPSPMMHFEIGGVYRHFRDWNPIGQTLTVTPTTPTTFDANGGGGFVNINVSPFKGMRILTNNFLSDGGGRYIFGQAPDLIIRADGSISPVKSGSTVSGFEYTHGNSVFYGYYGGIYIEKNITFDPALAGTGGLGGFVGYGFPAKNGGAASSTSQNRDIQEMTLGVNQTIWKDSKWGAVNVMGQYSYLLRAPWVVPNNGSPSTSHDNMVFMDLRYTLPGAAPTLGN
jgi:hypothetical protein